MAAKKKLLTIDVVALGKAGGKRRAENLTAARRSEIAPGSRGTLG
jgi:hypothetical protein